MKIFWHGLYDLSQSGCNVCDEVVFQTAITVVSIAKSYSNRGKHRHRPDTKKRWYLYYIDEDGKIRTRRINALEALYFRGKKTHRYKIAFPECGRLSLVFVKSLKEDVECPYCGCSIALDELDDDTGSVLSDNADDGF